MVGTREVIVVGGGVMGSAAAWQLARRGVDVMLIESASPSAPRGASFGGTRNFNPVYPEDTYLDFAALSRELWAELEDETDRTVLDRSGMVVHGTDFSIEGHAAKLRRFGFEVETLAPAAAAERWPGMRFEGTPLFLPRAGTIDSDLAVRSLQDAAAVRGADIRFHSRARRIRVLGDDRVQVEVVVEDETGAVLGEPETFEASRVVVTVGAWTKKLIGRAVRMPQLCVTHQQTLEFAGAAGVDLPVFNYHPSVAITHGGFLRPGFFGSPTEGGTRIGWHAHGTDRDPDAAFPARPDRRAHSVVRRFVEEWLPGLDPDYYVASPFQLKTSTRDKNFIVDAVGPLVVGAGFGGHGFKFAPAVGALLADLVQGGEPPALFSLRERRREYETV